MLLLCHVRRRGPWRRALHSLRHKDHGQTILLVITFALISALLVTVVINASKAFLYRRSLAGWADGAAISAAQQVGSTSLLDSGVSDALPLAEAQAQDEVRRYLRAHRVGEHFQDLSVVDVSVSPDDGVVSVTLRADMTLAVANVLARPWQDGVPITVTSSASVGTRD